MSRSQRHKVLIQGGDSAGKGLSEKQPAIVYIRQFAASQAFTVPVGPPGGPLQGSSIAGFPPTLIPAPGVMSERDGELREGEGEFTDPGQFNLSGNPIYTSLPPADGSTEPPVEPPVEPSADPTLTSLDPASAAVGAADFELHVHGSNFTPTSVVVFNDTEQSTSFLSDVELATVVVSSTVTDVATVPVLVREGSFDTTPLDFSFTVAEAQTQETVRNFPIGPFDLQLITSEDSKLRFLVAPDTPVRVGDEILIEATSNTSVNSSYIVETVAYNADGVVVVVDNVNGVALASPIDGRGRLTVTG